MTKVKQYREPEQTTLLSVNCPHVNVEERVWGRKTKYHALVCKDCGLVLQMEKIRKGKKR